MHVVWVCVLRGSTIAHGWPQSQLPGVHKLTDNIPVYNKETKCKLFLNPFLHSALVKHFFFHEKSKGFHENAYCLIDVTPFLYKFIN